MKLQPNSILIFCFLLLSYLSHAQNADDKVLADSKFLFPDFTEGTLYFKDGSTANAKFNYDNELDQMQFIGSNNQVLAIAEPEKVLKLVIASRTFLFLKDNFAEIISDGPISVCMRIHVKSFTAKIGAYGGTSYGSSIDSYSTYTPRDGSHAKLSANEKVTYQVEYIYYLMFGGKTKAVSSQYDLLKCFPSKKALLKQELEKQHVRFDAPDSFKQFIAWMNAQGITE